MKKNITFFVALFFTLPILFGESSYIKKDKIYPDSKRPQKATQEQISFSNEKNPEHSGTEYQKECEETFRFGLQNQIVSLLETLTQEEDVRFKEEAYDLFWETKSVSVREKIINYFAKLKDSCLEDFTVEVINDPYDEKRSTVDASFSYISSVKSKAAIPGVIDLIDKEEADYFSQAISCLGEIGGDEEANFLADFVDRDDLSVGQRQSLVKVLGKLKAESTWEKLASLAEDENENLYVRMYAAEAIGAIGKPDAENILIELFESDDPNLRVYVIKGISYYEDSKSDALLLQGLRDAHYKVRLEAIDTCAKRKLSSAVPYLIYRCRDKDEEKVVKEKCYKVLSQIGTTEANDYLISLIKDKKTSETVASQAASALLENGNAGRKEIIALAEQTLKDDKKKNLRYALGKEFAKYGTSDFEDICEKYLQSSDIPTQGTGLDIFARGKYNSLRSQVESIAWQNGSGKKKRNANANKAASILKRLYNWEEPLENSTETAANATAANAAAEK